MKNLNRKTRIAGVCALVAAVACGAMADDSPLNAAANSAAGTAPGGAKALTGAKTALVERYGSLGGLFTNGMVLKLMCTSARGADGKFRFVTKGVCEDFVRRAEALNASVPALTAHQLDVKLLQKTLVSQGACLA